MDNDEIAGDVGVARKAEDKGDIGDTGDVGEAENTGDTRDAKDVGDKETGKSNDRTADGGDQKDGKIDKAGDGGNPEDVEMRNDSIANGGNQDNRHTTVKDVVNFDDGVVAAIDPTDKVIADILAHPFGPLLPCPNSPLGVTVICFSQSHGNKSKFFPFIFLLTSLRGLT